MRNERRTGAIKPLAYQLPEDEFRLLKNTRAYMLMMADLAAPVTQAEGEEPVPLSRYAVAHCFERLGRELDEVIEKVWWPGE